MFQPALEKQLIDAFRMAERIAKCLIWDRIELEGGVSGLQPKVDKDGMASLVFGKRPGEACCDGGRARASPHAHHINQLSGPSISRKSVRK